jgi:hypothetical protein
VIPARGGDAANGAEFAAAVGSAPAAEVRCSGHAAAADVPGETFGFEDTFRESHAMAGKKKGSKSLSYTQRIAQVATVGMPAPVQQVAMSKLGSRLFLLLIPILIATGVISVSFSGGIPSVTFNRDRAQAVGRELGADAMRAAERVRQANDPTYR